MIDFKVYSGDNKPDHLEKERIVEFLHAHLEQYRDSKTDIGKAVDYALRTSSSSGGFIVTANEQGNMLGAVVMNRTGMEGYIPENILVYIATHGKHRGEGIGRKLMQKAIKLSNGNIALHVEHDNPARHLYNKLGFTSKYMEMRLIKETE